VPTRRTWCGLAVQVGFYDRSHLNRHFTGMLATTPTRHARSRRASSAIRVR
jgi:transcriptional regulator GlxA family with amidase domain